MAKQASDYQYLNKERFNWFRRNVPVGLTDIEDGSIRDLVKAVKAASDPIWLTGDFQSLNRSLSNVLRQAAVKAERTLDVVSQQRAVYFDHRDWREKRNNKGGQNGSGNKRKSARQAAQA